MHAPMNSPDSQPKLPTWIFIVTDLALIGAAGLVVWFNRPLTPALTLVAVGCVALGAIVGLVPLIARYERQKNEVLDERQRALEALARTVSSSAEQISIAAGGLHDMLEIAQKNLRHAEQLPHKLQDKMAEFQAQLSAADEAEREELERELLSLRTSESERLESTSQRIAKSTAEWTKLEAATRQHLAAAHDALAKISTGTATALDKARAAAEQAMAEARSEAARDIGTAAGSATRAIEEARVAALAALEAGLATAATKAARQIGDDVAEAVRKSTAAVETTIARLEGAVRTVPSSPPAEAPVEPTAPEVAADVGQEPVTAPVKRVRKPRREETAGTESGATAEAPSAPAEPAPPPTAVVAEPAPVLAAEIPEIPPVAPATADPFATQAPPETTPPAAEPAFPSAPVKAVRKRAIAPRKADAADQEPALGLELDDFSAAAPGGPAERVLTSDGATRVLVTAYIGIGNRLFIRGDGPGLSWDKGVPLQFISIGKWRWETNDATAPLRFKLYKNDEIECAALGTQTLEPGHQQELTAAF